MALVIPQDFAHVIYSLRFDTDPQLQAVTFGVEVDTGTPPTDPNDLAQTMSDVFDDNLMVVLWAGITHVNTEVKWQVTALPDPPLVGAAASSTTGGNSAATVLPQNSAFLVHKRTSLGGRRGRGRCYFPGVPEAAADNVGNVGGATLTAWNAALEDFRTGIVAEASLVNLVVLHADSLVSATPDPSPISSMSLDPLIATQRRRLRP